MENTGERHMYRGKAVPGMYEMGGSAGSAGPWKRCKHHNTHKQRKNCREGVRDRRKYKCRGRACATDGNTLDMT